MSIAALIVAGGSGSRAGDGPPKQYRELAGRPMLRRAVEVFRRHSGIPLVQVVIGAEQDDFYPVATGGQELLPPVSGGSSRQESVRLGLEALAPHRPEHVLIHDAARPLVSPSLIGRVVKALRAGAEAVVPLLPVIDSLKQQSANGSWASVSREGIHRAQTPQGFRFEQIRSAHHRFAGQAATDDIALAELAGLKITAVPGEEINMKITTAADFALAERLIAGGSETLTGLGFDAHRFVPGDHLWLCGVRIAHDRALEGHSDADAGLHALTDALLGALGAGDIGQHFPSGDSRWRGTPSSTFLAHAADLVREAGGAILHCDITLICERPKIAPHVPAMRARIAEILTLDAARVSVKATTTEGMGFTGRGEGLAAQAVATIRLPAP
ncbi:MAG TPA: bifunctional 2-C-methyl-D-erythritol 4-phosphate cytidylyltransferase/2-C-methyl-D-erythritol 2,4-cyclodiphosphate synthase [Rhizomicrobium sp.]|jgi:2-C-methyl-D-erythritol 4-phosphate cytidylyltransferase/2-C-methyl-D-erythritol 2,4-cyclodiphosphate synthase